MRRNIMTILGGVKSVSLLLVMGASSCHSHSEKENISYKRTESQIINVENEGENNSKVHEDFVEINEDLSCLIFDLRYTTTNNFLKSRIYPCGRVFLRKDAAAALVKASLIAKKHNVKLVVFDAYRPLSIQKKMYDMVRNPDYVADPKKGSKHNRGCAVDVSLASENGLIDMGTDFDDFTEKAHYNSNKISVEQKVFRLLLKTIMAEAGFNSYDKEWWHFNYKNTDYPLSDFQWSCDK